MFKFCFLVNLNIILTLAAADILNIIYKIEIFYLHGDSLFKAGFGNIIEAGPELLVDGNLFFSNRVGNQGRAKDKQHYGN